MTVLCKNDSDIFNWQTTQTGTISSPTKTPGRWTSFHQDFVVLDKVAVPLAVILLAKSLRAELLTLPSGHVSHISSNQQKSCSATEHWFFLKQRRLKRTTKLLNLVRFVHTQMILFLVCHVKEKNYFNKFLLASLKTRGYSIDCFSKAALEFLFRLSFALIGLFPPMCLIAGFWNDFMNHRRLSERKRQPTIVKTISAPQKVPNLTFRILKKY